MKKFICFLLLSVRLAAYDDRPACYKELERNFFQYKYVAEALALYNVNQSQGQWDGIVKTVQNKAKEAEYVIKEKARRHTPDPLQHPFQSDVAKDLLRETMFQIFERALLESGFFDQVTIAKMFEFIWNHDPRIQACLPETSTSR